MDLSVIKAFLNDSLPTKRAVEEAAGVIGVSVATMYRYKADPASIAIGQLSSLASHFGLPLTSGAAWAKTDEVGAERRRLALETTIAKDGGRRLITVPAYTVNSELPELTRLILNADYGSRAHSLESEIVDLRQRRARLYDEGAYESWEIWNGLGYYDFFHGRDRFKSIPENLRQAQVRRFIDSTNNPKRHRFFYVRNTPDLPMFGCHWPPGVALVRIDDIHLESQDHQLVENFESTFNEYRERCATRTVDQFVAFLKSPELPS